MSTRRRPRLTALRDAREPFRIGEFNLESKPASACRPDHGTTTELLLKHADVAMYVAKRCNSRVELYDPEQDHHSTRRLNLMGQLRSALADGQVVLYYQPKLELRRGRVNEVEALVRWSTRSSG
jgi:predicted signal transduction protein with EAL and GGDEF domain